MAAYSVQGKSGKYYDYLPTDIDSLRSSLLWQSPASFIFVKWSNSARSEIIYAGEAASLIQFLTTTSFWEIGQKNYGATAFYARPNGNAKERKAEKEDVVAKHWPRMNRDYSS